jgi:hypothetical protein
LEITMNTARHAFLLTSTLTMSLLPAMAMADDSDIRALREELQHLKQSYEQRIGALEARLAQAESAASKAEMAATQAANSVANSAASPALAIGQRQTSDNAFNPSISMVLSGMYTRLGNDPKTYGITGFVPSQGDVAPPPHSFSLGESEVSIAANVDQLFRGVLTFSLPPEQGAPPTVEEGFIQTIGLGNGLNLKAGRFLSGIGYMNEQHAHAWDFSDAPLAYKAFFGNQLKGEGLQLKWLAPTDTFLEFGAEVGRGGAFPSTDRNSNGVTLAAFYAHAGGDIGLSNSWRAGLSFVGTDPRDRSFDVVETPTLTNTYKFGGKSRTWIADAVWKWSPDGNPHEQNLTAQGEYFHRTEDGTLAAYANGTPIDTESFASRQSGWYLQGAYQFMPNWRVGLRHDKLDYGTIDNQYVADIPILMPYNPSRNTLMLDWNPSEFSRIRLQVARDNSLSGIADNQVILQYLMSLGPHGAHKF